MNLGSTELLIVVVIAVVLFGSNWLPKAARNLGRAKVEVDKVQKQINETKTQVVEATGIDKADEALRKANRALNSSPQSMMKNAAKSAILPTAAADSVSSDGADGADGADAADEIEDAVVIESPDQTPATEATLNVDFTDD